MPRLDEVAGLEGGFAHQGAQGLSPAQAAHARFGETHGLDCRAWVLGGGVIWITWGEALQERGRCGGPGSIRALRGGGFGQG